MLRTIEAIDASASGFIRRRLPAAALTLGVAGFLAPTAGAEGGYQLTKNTISVGGQDRTYYYFVSSKIDRRGFNPVVYALRDDGETVEQFAEQSGWMKVAEDNGFVVVFPDSAAKSWAPSDGEDAYLKAVYDDAGTHMIVPGGAPGGDAGEGNRRGAGEGNRGGGNRGAVVRSWFPFQYLTGVGAGARVAQAFAINHPGIYAAMATLDGGPFNASYARGDEPAQGYFQRMRAKDAVPSWKPLKKDVPVAVWLFSSAAPQTKLADHWKKADRVAGAARSESIGGFETAVYADPQNKVQEVLTTSVPASTHFDEKMASLVWSRLFAHVARWTSSPNGDLGPLLTQAEVNSTFDVRAIDVDGGTYKYYLKVPSSYRKGQSLPLVISAHGFAFPAWLYLSQIKMHEVGEREGFMTAYIQGQNNGWDFTDPDGADSQFVQKVIADIENAYGADAGRIYMQGFSFGSGLTYMMGVTHPHLFAAVSPNSGIGPMSKAVEARIADIKRGSDAHIPMMIVYGDVDSGASTDGKIPAEGVLRGAFDEIKAYNHVTTPDKTVQLNSAYAAPYDVLVPGGKLVHGGVDSRYPEGRFEIYQYVSADAKPLNLFDFVWVVDMPHGGDPRQAQLEWDYFKQWRRNSDGSLSYVGHQP